MNAQRSGADRDAHIDADKPSDAAALAQAEAKALVAQLEQDLSTLQAFVDAEKHAVKRKSPSPKRLARLRLVGEDITSAVKLSSKAAKN